MRLNAQLYGKKTGKITVKPTHQIGAAHTVGLEAMNQHAAVGHRLAPKKEGLFGRTAHGQE